MSKSDLVFYRLPTSDPMFYRILWVLRRFSVPLRVIKTFLLRYRSDLVFYRLPTSDPMFYRILW
jgi:hypothetical protein